MKKFIGTIVALSIALASAMPATAQETAAPKNAELVLVKDGEESKLVYVWPFTESNGYVGHLLATFCGEKEELFISSQVISSNRDCDKVRIDADAIVKKLNG